MILADHASRYFLPFGGALAAAAGGAGRGLSRLWHPARRPAPLLPQGSRRAGSSAATSGGAIVAIREIAFALGFGLQPSGKGNCGDMHRIIHLQGCEIGR